MNQEMIFDRREGDKWFERNKAAVQNLDKFDWPIHRISSLAAAEKIGSVLELGCSNGWRLAALRSALRPGTEFTGVDLSAQAIADGQSRFPGIRLVKGRLSDVPLDGEYDLVVLNFVLHWAERSLLIRCYAEIDRLIREGGYLLIGDFLPDRPTRTVYHHCPEDKVFTYKQDYPASFLATGLYKEISRIVFNHDKMHDREASMAGIDGSNRAVLSLLQKNTSAGYGGVL